ncbi:MAG: hypothetical protein JXA10_06955 [Anaerolineae bacterium]|nr:hypothetical protein [Anaerolineae bacterium]
MGFHRFRQAAHHILTVTILLTVVFTTFVPQWATSTQASADPASAYETTSNTVMDAATDTVSLADLSEPAARPVEVESSTVLVPMNTLILTESGAVADLTTAITEAGGSVYLRQGDALFAGVKGLDDTALATLGARTTYRDVVADSALATLTTEEQATITVWNSLINRQPLNFSNFIASGADASSAVFASVNGSPANSVQAEAYDPTDTQTSSFLYGDVAVQVIFVESTGAGENWAEAEITKVKAEISQALDWWSTVSPVPAPGGEGNPVAHVSWDVSYYSATDNAADYAKIQIAQEPIDLTVADAADPDVGWMQTIATNFTGVPGNAGLRLMADTARDNAGTDWGMVLFVVDSSNDADGRFSDQKISGAALNGPWAIVTYNAGDLGIDNLEVPVAKMVGHVFGAGDEGWTPEFGGCRPTEVYGYLRVDHTNCEYDLNPRKLVPSLMRSGEIMVSAYSNFQLSEEARGQVGWEDGNGDGVYDVVNNMQNGFAGYASAPICPVLRFNDVPILNAPFVPEGYTLADSWTVEVFDPEALNGLGELKEYMLYSPVNINAPQAVWGRVNAGPWQVGYPANDGNWNSKDETYNLTVNGWAGVANNVELIVLDRWENPIITDPVVIDIAVPPAAGTFEAENRATPGIDLFNFEGIYEAGWASGSNALASGGAYMFSGSEAGNEACFTFDGRMAQIQYVPDPAYDTNKAQVYVDGELHSFIYYDGATTAPMTHLIANLSDEYHTVQVVSEIGPITMDNFNIWEIGPEDVIHGTQPGGAYAADVSAGNAFFYENTGVKYFPNGAWATTPLPASTRPGTPDNSAKSSAQLYDRLYMFVDQAHIAAIYREVGPGMGTANVYVDGAFRGVMNNEAAFSDVVPFYIGGLDPDPAAPDPWYHAIELRVNAGSTGVNVDAVRVLYKDDSGVDFMPAVASGATADIAFNDPLVTQEEYGTWVPQNTAKVYQSREMGSTLTFFFEGTAMAALVRTNALNGGTFEMYVDGELIRTVDTKTLASVDAPIIAHGFDPDFPHVLQIRHVNVVPTRLWWTQYRGFRVYNIPPITPDDCGINSNPDAQGRGGCQEYVYGDDTVSDPLTSVFLYEQLWRFIQIGTGDLPSDGRFIESKHKDSRIYLYVTGADTATLYGVSGLTYGTVEVLVDGELVGTWNLRRAIRGVDHPYTVTGLNPTKTQLIELRMQNGRGKMGFDRVVLYNRPTLAPNSTLDPSSPNANGYENDGTVGGVPALQFSGQWRRIADENSSNGTHELSAGAGDRVEFDVEGATSVVLYRRLQTAYGEANVYVNGELYGSFNNKLSSLTGVYQQPFTIAGLNPYFKNRIMLEGKMVKNWFGNYTAKPFDIDYVVVRQESDETAGSTYLEPGFYDDNDAEALLGGAITYIGDRWTIEGDVHRASTNGHKAQVIFEGDAFSAYINKSGLAGRVQVYVDGQLQMQMSPGGNTTDVPLTVVGLDYGIHVAEVVVVRGVLQINSFQVYDLTADVAPTYDLTNPIDQATFNTPGYLLSEEWILNAEGFLETAENDARLYAYLTGGDTLWLSHAAGVASAAIEIYVNGTLTSTLDTLSIRQQTPDAEGAAEYMVGGLMFMQDAGTWVEIRKNGLGKIQLKSMRVGNVADLGTLAVGAKIEAESVIDDDPPPAGFYLIGSWVEQPWKASDKYSNGFHMQSNSESAKALIVVEGAEYLTLYRTMQFNYNDAAIYVDGEYWGNMPNKSTRTQYQVPFTIGPFDPEATHAVELRQTGFQKYSIDYVQTTESLPGPIGAGFYENDDPVFADAYVGNVVEADNVSASGGSQHKMGGTGTRMYFTFTGNKITLYRQMWSLGGVTYVYIDGNPYSIFNRNLRTEFQVPYTIVLPTSGLHQFELVVGTQTTFVDAIEIGNIGPATYGAYQHDAPQVITNSDIQWTQVDDANHSAGSYIWTKEKYANVLMLFYGESVQIYSTQGRQWGMYSVYLDGEFIEEVDQYVNSATDIPFFKYEISGLEKENHILEFRFERHKNVRALALKANFDLITVDGFDPPLPGDDGDVGSNIPRVGCFEESDSKWVLYGAGDAWQYVEETSASGDLYLRGENFPNVSAEFMFQSSGFSLRYHTEGGAGKAIIEVDGSVIDIVDMSNVGYDSLNVTNLDPNELHVLRIRQGGGGPIFIDRLDLPSYNPSYDDNCRIQ